MERPRRRNTGPMPCVTLHSTVGQSHNICHRLSLTLPPGRTLFVVAFFSPDKEKLYPEHKKGNRANFLKALNQHLSSHELSQAGPFVIGNKITYADLVIYQICHDEQLTQKGREGLAGYPRLVKLVDAVEGRPNIKKFLESDRYLG